MVGCCELQEAAVAESGRWDQRVGYGREVEQRDGGCGR